MRCQGALLEMFYELANCTGSSIGKPSVHLHPSIQFPRSATIDKIHITHNYIELDAWEWVSQLRPKASLRKGFPARVQDACGRRPSGDWLSALFCTSAPKHLAHNPYTKFIWLIDFVRSNGIFSDSKRCSVIQEYVFCRTKKRLRQDWRPNMKTKK